MVLSRREHELLRQIEERLRTDDPALAARIDRCIAVMPCVTVERAPNSRPGSRSPVVWTAVAAVGALLLLVVLFVPTSEGSTAGETPPEGRKPAIDPNGDPGYPERGNAGIP
ncbi:DUF3040 family protein [Haloactinospora alba]|uniref:DUF3040 family protein n=2 Tax=Haloactinospora alba TaxID=405555 RepID=A0A543NIB1_9ACTN|nr:DUF3040 family protein [Haloactinospora alba]